jgi:hypothetical protein
MHYRAIIWIVGQQIRHDLAKSIRVKAFVYLFDGFMHIFFGSGNTTLIISI